MRRNQLPIVPAALAAIGLLALCLAPAQAGVTTRVSVSTGGAEANDLCYQPCISGDGRYVAFMSWASNLVPGDTNGRPDIFVHGGHTGETTRVSVAGDGSEGNFSSEAPSISADGRFVAFSSSANNLVAGDNNGVDDVFVHDRDTGETTCVSVATAGTQGNGPSWAPSISADGRYVAFYSDATNLVGGDTNGAWDIFVHDRQTGETTRVSVATGGAEANSSSLEASISGDGRCVAFRSLASNLVAGDTNAVGDIFVHDRVTGETARVSVDSDGAEGNKGSRMPSITADGRYVAFDSEASNLVAGDTNGGWDVFVHDRVTGETTRVSVASDGSEGNGYSFSPAISGDGRYVAFESVASNLVPGDTSGGMDVFVHHPQTGTTARVSVSSDGTEANMACQGACISADGCCVGFYSMASNLVAGDTNGQADVFVHCRWSPAICCFSYDPTSPEDQTPVQFTDCSTHPYGQIVAWDWDFGDGGTSSDQNPTHTYTWGGCFEAALTLTDSEGLSTTCSACVPVRSETEVPFCDAGWHMVAQPHSGDHALADVEVRDDWNGLTLAFCDATTAGWVQNPLFFYDIDLMGYGSCGCAGQPPPTTEHTLWMGYGYWMYTFQDYLTLVFP